jgi:RNA polymerase sigma-70 factor, ECF subfamily
VDERDWLAERFEGERRRLRAVAYRMLGSVSEAEDAVQEAWLRLDRSDADAVSNLSGWLTVVVGRVCLDMLRARRARQEDTVGNWLPEPIVTVEDGEDPEGDAVLADSVGLALLVVLEMLTPPERLAFVLHDMFAVPFEEIAGVVGRSPAAARQLASRARRRVQGATPTLDTDMKAQRRVVDAFLAASRNGDFEGLVALLDPGVVFRIDGGRVARMNLPTVHGAEAVARTVLEQGAPFAPLGRPATVNGGPGVVVESHGKAIAVGAFSIAGGKIVAIDIIADPEKLRSLEVTRREP